MKHQWQWRVLRAGSFRLDGGSMFGVVPKTIWSKLAPPDEHNRIPMQTNCLVLDDGSRKVLIETGFGDKWSDKERGFYELERRTVVDALREVQIEPAQIDAVIVTHLHFDHAAALTHANSADQLAITFPNANVFVQKAEWDDALANRSTMTRTYLRSHLDPLASSGCVHLLEGFCEALPGIHVEPAPGHTFAQQLVRFEDDRGTIAFLGDVIPTTNHAGLAFSMAYDMLPYQNMLTKKLLLQRAHHENWTLVLDHEPGNPIVRVAPGESAPGKESQFTLKPVNPA